ncbi:MAG: multicopper oxidase domain-containing protein [Flavobacteriales bacterium]|nr:multicopper oxidase domain-containing protein [Flavobacteriales bacterium]
MCSRRTGSPGIRWHQHAGRQLHSAHHPLRDHHQGHHRQLHGQGTQGLHGERADPHAHAHIHRGDTALIIVHNAMEKEETSLHWHGIILPNRFDGVPYLTTPPIKAGETQVYKFPLVQSGTYWYHSHTNLQEQNGMHGALIIHKRNDEPLPEHVLISASGRT